MRDNWKKLDYPRRALDLLYFERKGTSTLELYWKQPGDEDGGMALVPAEAFAHLKAD